MLQFPTLKDSVYGEESGKFSMHDGSETVVEMCATVQETEAMLTNILGEDRRRVARLLATEAHSEAALTWSHHEEATCCELREMRVDFNHLGVWIDPIGELVHIQVTQCMHGAADYERDGGMLGWSHFIAGISLLSQSVHED